jgi:hypothetical protein
MKISVAYLVAVGLLMGGASAVQADPLLSVGGISIGDSGVSGPISVPQVQSTVESVTSTVQSVISGGSGSTSVGDIASVSNSGTPTQGSSTTASILGGGGDAISVNTGSLLGGSGSSLTVELPSTGTITGGLPLPTHNQPGAPGPSGSNGVNGNNGVNGVNGTGGGLFASIGNSRTIFSSGSTSPGSAASTGVTNSSRLKMLIRIMDDRDWLKLVGNNQICLGRVQAADVGQWLPKTDWAGFRRVIGFYDHDIKMLQKLLASCKSNRAIIGSATIRRVIGLDLHNGKPVLFLR